MKLLILAWTFLCILCGEVCARSRRDTSRRTRSDRHVYRHRHQHLQEQIDRLLLRQEADHVLLQVLQREIEQLRSAERDLPTEAVKGLAGQIQELRLAVSESVNKKKFQDVPDLRFSLEKLSTASILHEQKEQQDSETLRWVVRTVGNLQKDVEGIEETLNVTSKLRSLQHLEDKFAVVRSDVDALRSSLAAVTASVEKTLTKTEFNARDVGEVETLSRRNSKRVADLTSEVASLKAGFDELLASFPDGFFLKDKDAKDAKEASRKLDSFKDSYGRQRMHVLEEELKKTKTRLDRLEDSEEILKMKEQADSECSCQDLESRIRENKENVKDVQVSSVQLLSALDSLEEKQDKSSEETRITLAKLEFNITRAEEERKDLRMDYKKNKELLFKLQEDFLKDIAVEDSRMLHLEEAVQEIRLQCPADIIRNIQVKLEEMSMKESLPKGGARLKKMSAKETLQELKLEIKETLEQYKSN